MDGTVTISLTNYEGLKQEIESLKKSIHSLESIVCFYSRRSIVESYNGYYDFKDKEEKNKNG